MMKELYSALVSGGIIISLITIISWWVLFKRAGYSGWYAIVPILNVYIFCEMITGSGWLFLFMFIPGLNLILIFYLLFRLSFVFGHGIGFALGLTLLYPLFMLILVFGGSQYYSQ